MKQKYNTATINRALNLVNSGMTRKAAAKKAGINQFSLNYYISKTASPKLRKILLRKTHIEAIKTLQALIG